LPGCLMQRVRIIHGFPDWLVAKGKLIGFDTVYSWRPCWRRNSATSLSSM
jgi:hypothetical protein